MCTYIHVIHFCVFKRFGLLKKPLFVLLPGNEIHLIRGNTDFILHSTQKKCFLDNDLNSPLKHILLNQFILTNYMGYFCQT